MGSIFVKLLIVLIFLVAWVAYDNWGKINTFSSVTLKNAVNNSLSSASRSKKSIVYQWQDEKGRVHVSSSPPDNAHNVKEIEYDNDMNVVVPTHQPEKTSELADTTAPSPSSESNSNNPVKHYQSAVKDARGVQNQMNNRNQKLQDRLN